MNQYVLKTLGCKANFYDSQQIEKSLQEKGWAPGTASPEEVRVCVINSCTVTDEADKQTKRLAKKLSKEYPNAAVVVTGCGAEVDPEELSKASGIDFVVGNQNKNQFADLIQNKIGSHILSTQLSPNNPKQKILGTTTTYSEILSRHPMDREWPAIADSFQTPPTELAGYTAKTRSFLKIQEGCNSFCSYCIIPYGRGPSRSLPPDQVLQQVRDLVTSGIREIVLTGTNIGEYGVDLFSTPHLTALLRRIFEETSLERLRLSSLDPTEIPREMIDLLRQYPQFCPHFHVSLQSPHSKILRMMKRKYRFEEVQSCLHAIAEAGQENQDRGGVFVGMDLITGFPGETDEEFDWCFQALQNLPWNRLHVFPYSERKGTPATRLPGAVPKNIRIERGRKLNQLSLERLKSFHENLLASFKKSPCSNSGVLKNVLFESGGSQNGWVGGYTPNYLRVLVPYSGTPLKNLLADVTLVDVIVDSKTKDVAFVGRLL